MASRRTFAGSTRGEALAKIRALLDGVSPEAIAKADDRAVATVRRRFAPAAGRLVRETYNVRQKEIASKFTVREGRGKTTGTTLDLYASTYKIPLARFGGRWPGRRSKGASAAILKGQGRKIYHSAFIARINGDEWMLVRQFSRDSHLASGRDPRNKLKRLAGPSPRQMVLGRDNTNALRLSEEMHEVRANEVVRLLRLTRKGKL